MASRRSYHDIFESVSRCLRYLGKFRRTTIFLRNKGEGLKGSDRIVYGLRGFDGESYGFEMRIRLQKHKFLGNAIFGTHEKVDFSQQDV